MHMNPEQNEFCKIKRYALTLLLSNPPGACSSGNAYGSNLWLVLQSHLMKLQKKSWVLAQFSLSPYNSNYFYMRNSKRQNEVLYQYSVGGGGVGFLCLVVLFDFFPQNNGGKAIRKQVDKKVEAQFLWYLIVPLDFIHFSNISVAVALQFLIPWVQAKASSVDRSSRSDRVPSSVQLCWSILSPSRCSILC